MTTFSVKMGCCFTYGLQGTDAEPHPANNSLFQPVYDTSFWFGHTTTPQEDILVQLKPTRNCAVVTIGGRCSLMSTIGVAAAATVL